MIAIKRILVVVVFCMNVLLGYGQADIHFSQFYENAILRNPGLTGVFADDYKVSCFYRTQWYSVGVPYNTYLVSGAAKVPAGRYGDDFFSFGLLAYRDQAGTAGQQITAVYPTFNYNKSLNPDYNSYLSFGVCAAYAQYSFDPGKVTFNNQYQNGSINTSLPSLENISRTKNSFWNLAAGINFNFSNNQNNDVVYCFGISGYNLAGQTLSYLRNGKGKLNLRGNLNAGVSISLREDISIQLQGNYARQDNFSEIAGAFLWIWTPMNRNAKPEFSMTLGGIYRYGDAVAPVVKFRYQRVAVAASYDVNVSTFNPATNYQGGIELSLSVSGSFNNESNANKTIICPRF